MVVVVVVVVVVVPPLPLPRCSDGGRAVAPAALTEVVVVVQLLP